MLYLILKRFIPKEHYPSIYEIDYEALYSKGFRGLIFDIDNTVAPCDVPKPPKKAVKLLKRLSGMGFSLCLLSNNSKKRVGIFNKGLCLPSVHRAGKPGKKGIGQAVMLCGVKAGQAVLIGDQLFTDVWGGNRCGVYTVLVDPVADRDEWTVWLKRKPEAVLKYFLRKKNLILPAKK
jgi:hypothetical protein